MARKPLTPQMRGAVRGALSNAIRDRLIKCANELNANLSQKDFDAVNVEMTALLIAFDRHVIGEDD